jgi:hypothetical protein
LQTSDATDSSTPPFKQMETLEFTIEGTGPGTLVVATRTGFGGARALASISNADPTPVFPDSLCGASRVIALDVLEYVVDEESWIRVFAEAVAPGGELVIRVPADGPLTWLDAVNLYRYVQDITGWGKKLEDIPMKGWHRHYLRQDLQEMLEDAGLTVSGVERSGSPHLDALQFGMLLWGKLIRHDDDAERRATLWRDAAETGAELPRFGPLSTKITIRAVKQR